MKGFEGILLYGVLGITLVALFLSIFSFVKPINVENVKEGNQMPRMSRMTLTEFDMVKGREFMDKDNDGRCDVCGMPVDMCLDAGQMQCNMGGEATMGVLDSQHIHADFKVFTNGKPVNFADEKYYMKSSFVHVDQMEDKEDASGVLHMHATGIPLWLFFESIGMKLPSSIRVYVNEELNDNGLDYVFKDLDKVLITEAENDAKVNEQMKLITDYAEKH